jgi:hypothetical protein
VANHVRILFMQSSELEFGPALIEYPPKHHQQKKIRQAVSFFVLHRLSLIRRRKGRFSQAGWIELCKS